MTIVYQTTLVAEVCDGLLFWLKQLTIPLKYKLRIKDRHCDAHSGTCIHKDDLCNGMLPGYTIHIWKVNTFHYSMIYACFNLIGRKLYNL